MVRRLGIIILALALAIVFISGCQKGIRLKPPEKKPALPEKSKSISGTVKAILGKTIVVDVKGKEIKILVDDKTTYQKGNQSGGGALSDIRPGIKVDILMEDDKAIAIHYKGEEDATKD